MKAIVLTLLLCLIISCSVSGASKTAIISKEELRENLIPGMKAEEALEYLAQFPGEIHWAIPDKTTWSSEFDWSEEERDYYGKLIRKTTQKWWAPSLESNINVRVFVDEQGIVTRTLVRDAIIGWP